MGLGGALRLLVVPLHVLETHARELVAYSTDTLSFACGIHFVRKSAGMLGSSTCLSVTSPDWMRCLSTP